MRNYIDAFMKLKTYLQTSAILKKSEQWPLMGLSDKCYTLGRSVVVVELSGSLAGGDVFQGTRARVSAGNLRRSNTTCMLQKQLILCRQQ